MKDIQIKKTSFNKERKDDETIEDMKTKRM